MLKMGEMTTSERLLAAAEHILVTRGVTGISVRKVGDQAGVNPTLVTYHFRSIENLLNQLATCNLEPILDQWRTIELGMPLEEVLERWFDGMRTPARFTPGGRALIVADELAMHGVGTPQTIVIRGMENMTVRLREAVQPHCPHLDPGELRARLRFIAGAVLGPPPRTHGAPVLEDGRALDKPEFLMAFALAALAGQAA